ncbi:MULTISPECIES: hypothetical protein [Sphingobacterium]|uniref:hypothetical protein n=1 Tax=Sphingobacterium TaxID=28453 RepID=UPI00257E5ADB|nr:MULTISPECIES: hypothetical protein [Sphingobacterium]
MKLLRNFELHDILFDLESGEEFKNLEPVTNIYGWYRQIEDVLTALYVEKNELYLLFGTTTFHVGDHCKVNLIPLAENTMELLIYHKEDLIVRFSFPFAPKFNYPAPFDDLNDLEQDWGLFIQEIINNPLRRRNMISNLME